MSFLDPIESGLNSILDPLTSDLLSDPSSTQPVKPSSTLVNSPSTPTKSTNSAISSSPDTEATSSPRSQAQSTATSHVASTKTSATGPTSSQDTSDDNTTLTPTTFSTLTKSSSAASKSSTISASSTSDSTQASTPAAPSAFPPLSTSPSNSTTTTTNNNNNNSTSSNGISTAGIAIAVAFGIAILISIVYMTIRFCPPVRRRYDAWRDRGREERTYREALDGPGPAIAEKDDAYSFASVSSHSGKIPIARPMSAAALPPPPVAKDVFLPRSEAASKEIFISQHQTRSFSFDKNPTSAHELESIDTRNGPLVSPDGSTVHHQYVSPISASSDGPARGDGLGLGRVSLLRNESLLRKAGYDVPVSAASYEFGADSQPKAEIAMVGVGAGTGINRGTVSGNNEQMGVRQVEVKRKPVAARPPPVARPFSYELPTVSERMEEQQQQQQPQPQLYRKSGHVIRHESIKEEEEMSDHASQMENINPHSEGQRLSQIGLAMSSTPQPNNRNSVGLR